MSRVVVVGDALLDRDLDGRVERLAPDAPVPVVDEPVEAARPGGAGLAAVLAARDGHHVTLVCALGDDAPGRALRGLLEGAGIEVIDLRLRGPTPEKVRVRGGGRTLLRVDRGGRDGTGVEGDTAALERARAALAAADGVLVACYGRGVSALAALREAIVALPAHVPLVWDPHPRGAEPVTGAALVTPNAGEAIGFAGADEGVRDARAVERAARRLARRWRAVAVCVTRGRDGALLVEGDGPPRAVPAPRARGGDPCGAGDRFASRAAGLLAAGELPAAAVADAVEAASAFVEAGGAAAVDPAAATPAHGERGARSSGSGHNGRRRRRAQGEAHSLAAAEALAREVQRHGGTVVATGGCFDLLHAGHVGMLAAARALGDALIVLLNSDASVRRLKGDDRPLNPQSDRAAVLAALAPVDAVAVFDEDTPEAALERLRPDVWAKGGDYAVADLPEARVVERWGGQAVILPYMAGRSTTRLIEEAVLRGRG